MDLTHNFKNRPWDTDNELNYDSQPNFEFQYHYNSIIINAVCCFCLIYTVNYFWLFSCKVEHWNIIMKINFIIFTLMNPKISEIMKQCCKFVKNHFCFLWCLDFNYELASKSETRLFIHNNLCKCEYYCFIWIFNCLQDLASIQTLKFFKSIQHGDIINYCFDKICKKE